MSDNKETRPYNMSPAAVEARRANAQLSTGPKTEEGKAASARNAWKHGMRSDVYGADDWKLLGVGMNKPCKSTCPKYPCSLVDDGATSPGQDCKDKQIYVQAFESIVQAIEQGDLGHLAGMQAHQLAAASDIMNQMQEAIRIHGAMVAKPILKKGGDLVTDHEGKAMYNYIPNPLIVPYFKMLGDLGVTFTEQMLTPKAVAKVIDEDEAEDALSDLFTRLGRVADKTRVGQTFDADVEDAEVVRD